MPRVEQLPPNVAKITTELTLELSETFNINESKEIRDNKIVTYLIKQIAILENEIKELKNELSKN